MNLLTLPRRMACGLLVLCACSPSVDGRENQSSPTSSSETQAKPSQDQAANPAPGDDLTRAAAASCPPPGLFSNALCLCEDLVDVGLLSVRGGAGGPGSVGVNGKTHLVNLTTVDGSFDAYQGFAAVAAAEIGANLSTTGDASWVGQLAVGGDLNVGGDARGLGLLSVDGTLRVAGHTSLVGLTVADQADYEPPAAPPCPCDPGTFFDVAAAVDAAREQNDNASISLGDTLHQVGLRVLTLPSGSYYVDDARTVGALDIVITGSVKLYVAGQLDSVGLEHFHIQDGGELDLYVSGGLRTVGLTAAGSVRDPSRLRIYVGGTAPVLVSVGAQVFFGAIYAPQAQVTYVGATHIVGSLFARTLHGVGALVIEHGDTGPSDPGACTPPEDDPDADGGVPPGDPETPGDGDGAGDGDGDGDAGLPVAL
jgi:hypothetical protein